MLREGVRDRQQIPVEVHAPLGPPGRTGREGDQRHVVGRRPHRRVRPRRPVRRRQTEEVLGAVPAEGGDPQPRDVRLREVVHMPQVAQRVGHPRQLADRRQFLRPLLRQHRHRDRPRLEHRQPARGQPGCGGPPQQDPVAGDHAEGGREGVGDPVDSGTEFAVRPHLPGGRAEDGPAGIAAVEQLGGGVEPVRIAQLGEVEGQLGPLVRRWETVTGEGVDVGGDPGSHDVRPLLWSLPKWARMCGGLSHSERIALVTAVNSSR